MTPPKLTAAHYRSFGITLLASVAIAGAAALTSPAAGEAQAHGYSTPSGDAVGRPGLDNPAPVVRLTQAVGDHIFNPDNKALDESPLGQNYHSTFGTPNYSAPTHGSNGTWKGVLNAPGKLKDNYNAAQSAGTRLPEEKDLSGAVVRTISGAPVPAPHQTSNSSGHSAAPAASRCTVAAQRISLRAQGSC